MNKLKMTSCHCQSFKKHNIEHHLKFIRQSTFRLISSKNLIAKTQYGIKGNFFVNHFCFIMNSVIFIFLQLVFLTTNFISLESQRFFRYLLLRKPLIHLRNVCLEFSGCCVLINGHFDHVNEAAVQVYKWNIIP